MMLIYTANMSQITRSHDLNSDVVAQAMHTNFAKKFPGRYLTSNAYITVTDANNKAQKVPIGCRLFLSGCHSFS